MLRRPAQAVRGARALTLPSLRWLRPPGHKLSSDASFKGEIDDSSVDSECAAGSRFERHPVAPPIFDHPGRRGP
jgi:hypothetical protein